MAKVVVCPVFANGSLDWNSAHAKFTIQIDCGSDTLTNGNTYQYGGIYEFNWTDTEASIRQGIINLAITNGTIEGLTLSASDIKFLP